MTIILVVRPKTGTMPVGLENGTGCGMGGDDDIPLDAGVAGFASRPVRSVPQ
jgi:hypothetical protein